jgi:hypothetical protein
VAVVSVNSQYANGLYFDVYSRSFLDALMGNADDTSDLCNFSLGAGTLEAWP